ncbi:hypothetical protein GYMLUDRAFT_55528 [Collybiopsis luxurians FD-317 M1]|nr:hypothetical protein GYMLUDRAFT_55528 [Collybiopsis luxurians FD-317 M1]
MSTQAHPPSPQSPLPVSPPGQTTAPLPEYISPVPSNSTSLNTWCQGYRRLMNNWMDLNQKSVQSQGVISNMELQLAKQCTNMEALQQEVKNSKAELSCINQYLNNATKLLSAQHSIMESKCKDLIELEEVQKEVGVTQELHW